MNNITSKPSISTTRGAETTDFSAKPVRFTLFEDRFASFHVEVEEPSLDKLAKSLRATEAASKDKLPWIKLARVSGHPSDNGSLRYDAAITELWGVEGDYDGGIFPFEEAAGKIEAAEIEALLYETASSTPERPRWRVLAPTSRGYSGTTDELEFAGEVGRAAQRSTRWGARA